MMADIEMETVDMVPNFERKPPTSRRYCPPRIPTLIVNGSNGIAVGMATNIPPHNLTDGAERDHRAGKKSQRAGCLKC